MDAPQLDGLEITTDQERRRLFLRYLNRGWLLFGIITLVSLPFYPHQRSTFVFLSALSFPTYLGVRYLNLSGRTPLAGTVFTLSVNFGFFGLFLLLVRELGAFMAFETQATVWMLMGLAVIFAGAFVGRWAAVGLALFNTALLIFTQTMLAPASDPRPSAVVLWWMLALTIWLYESTLERAFERLRGVRGGLEDVIGARTRTLEEIVAQLVQAKSQLEAANKELEAYSSSVSQELDESEALFRQIFQISPTPMIITGEIITDVNDAFLHMTGYTREELVDNKTSEAYLWQEPAARARAVELLIQQGFLRDYEIAFLRKSGEEGVAVMSATLLKRPDGKLRYLCHVLDFTVRKQAEMSLRRSESLYRQAIEAANAVPYQQQYDVENQETVHFSFIGEGIEELTGYPADEFNQKLWKTLVEEVVLQGEQVGLSLDETIHPARTGESNIWQADYRIRTRDGQVRWVADAAVEIKNEEGLSTGSIGILQDITERKRLEQELADERDFVLQIINTMGQGLSVTNERGQFILVNPSYAQLTGYEPQEILGKSPKDMTVPEDLALVMQARDNRRLGKITTYENRLQHKDGSPIPVLITGVPRTKDGKYSGAIAVITDLREIKKAEQKIHELNAELEKRVIERTAQLEAANKELEAFSYSVSHDLRAPLRAVNGFSMMLAEEMAQELSSSQQRYLRLIQENVHRMNQLIEDLLAFSRLGRQPLRKQRVDINALLQDVLKEMQADFSGRQIDFALADLPSCEADSALMRVVFTNLIANALKYSRTRTAAQIEIGWQKREQDQVYFIRDNGVGFDMQYADKLFGVFQRLHRQDEFEGTGVGLATVQRILHRHGGRIWAEAEIDQGATFYFTVTS